MVREFTELQGIVGGLYARAQGEPEEIAWAVYDHYKPLGLDDPIPRNLTGCAVALADKLDSLVACFAVGAFRRVQVILSLCGAPHWASLRLFLNVRFPLSFRRILRGGQISDGTSSEDRMHRRPSQKQVLDFLLERARYILRERRGFAYDEINAAFAAGADDLVDAVDRVAALQAIRKTKNFDPLAVSFKRIRNILEKAAAAGDKVQGGEQGAVSRAAELQLQTCAQQDRRGSDAPEEGKEVREALQRFRSFGRRWISSSTMFW